MTDLEKVKSLFDELGITYKTNGPCYYNKFGPTLQILPGPKVLGNYADVYVGFEEDGTFHHIHADGE